MSRVKVGHTVQIIDCYSGPSRTYAAMTHSHFTIQLVDQDKQCLGSPRSQERLSTRFPVEVTRSEVHRSRSRIPNLLLDHRILP